jgi:hypothetical protein
MMSLREAFFNLQVSDWSRNNIWMNMLNSFERRWREAIAEEIHNFAKEILTDVGERLCTRFRERLLLAGQAPPLD